MFILDKKRAFTLIELLVVIVIIGILATLSSATYSKVKASVRDGERQVMLDQAYKIIVSSDIGVGDDEQYLLSQVELLDYFDSHKYEVLAEESGYCFLFISIQSSQLSYSNGKNEFILATWGETRGTDDTNKPGLLYKGTLHSSQKMSNGAEDWEDSFICDHWDGVTNNNFLSYNGNGHRADRLQFRTAYFLEDSSAWNTSGQPIFWDTSVRPLHTEIAFTGDGVNGLLCRNANNRPGDSCE